MPSLYIIAGPNGAGKTTFIKRFAPRHLALLDFINADEIARGLAPLAPQREHLEAERLGLANRVAELSAEIANYQRSPFSMNETPEN